MHTHIIHIFILRSISVRAARKIVGVDEDMAMPAWSPSTDEWQVVTSASGDEGIMFRRPDGTFMASPARSSRDPATHSMFHTSVPITNLPNNQQTTTRTPTNNDVKRKVRKYYCVFVKTNPVIFLFGFTEIW
jgi:hypothetical protein